MSIMPQSIFDGLGADQRTMPSTPSLETWPPVQRGRHHPGPAHHLVT
jgi:hypothetical protein